MTVELHKFVLPSRIKNSTKAIKEKKKKRKEEKKLYLKHKGLSSVQHAFTAWNGLCNFQCSFLFTYLLRRFPAWLSPRKGVKPRLRLCTSKSSSKKNLILEARKKSRVRERIPVCVICVGIVIVCFGFHGNFLHCLTM